MKLRLLSLAEADLLSGFQFYEGQELGVGTYFLESLYSDIESLHLYAGVHRQMYGYHRRSRIAFHSQSTTMSPTTRLEYGECWIVGVIPDGFVPN